MKSRGKKAMRGTQYGWKRWENRMQEGGSQKKWLASDVDWNLVNQVSKWCKKGSEMAKPMVKEFLLTLWEAQD